MIMHPSLAAFPYLSHFLAPYIVFSQVHLLAFESMSMRQSKNSIFGVGRLAVVMESHPKLALNMLHRKNYRLSEQTRLGSKSGPDIYQLCDSGEASLPS